MDLDIDNLRSWIGRTTDSGEDRAEVVTGPLAERFNATFDLTGPTGPGAPAPLMIHLCLAPPLAATADLGKDGHPARGGFLPPVPLPRRMWAGGALRFLDDIRIGETVSRRSVIRDVALKKGHSGALCFVTVDHRILADGRPVIEERQDIVYRGAGLPRPQDRAPQGGVPAPAPAPAPQGMHHRRMAPVAPLLFRYSALTFNAHRIHYDLPYAREVEGYPGLVVHGPLQATLLVQLAARLRGKSPAGFEFRSVSALFDTADFTLNAAEADGGLTLWTARPEGPVAMQARATW